jgi:hypothetical protein
MKSSEVLCAGCKQFTCEEEETQMDNQGDNQKQTSTQILLRYPGGLRFGDDPWSERSHAEVTVL